MDERANWLKAQSLIGKTKSLASQNVSSPFLQSARRLPQTTVALEGGGFQIADTSWLQRMPSPGSAVKEEKTAL